MSSLWTPYGEHPSEPEPAASAHARPEGPAGAPHGSSEMFDAFDAGDEAPMSPEQEEALREAFARLAQTPVAAIVADHAARLHELAVLHLGLAAEEPRSLGEARLAVDAMGALVEGLGDRLGDAAPPLAAALGQLRLAFVQISTGTAGGSAP